MLAGRFLCVASVAVAVAFLGGINVAKAQGCPLLYTFTGEAADDGLGWWVSDAGDVNGDGHDDLIVGAPRSDWAGGQSGHVYVFSGKDSTILYILTGEAEEDQFGFPVSGAGDVNGDGHADVIVGARFNDQGGTDAGRAYVFFGGAGPFPDTLPAASADLVVTGDAPGDRVGFAVSGAGDFNNDGYDDVMAGAPQDYEGGDATGRAYLIFGGPASYPVAISAANADIVFTGEAAGDLLYVVSNAGDVDGDGYDDVVVGATQYYTGGSDAGRAYVFLGGPGPFPDTTGAADADMIFTGEGGQDMFGLSVASAGDFNNDGYDDLIVGARNNDTEGNDAGRAYLFLGASGPYPATIPATEADIIFTGEAAGDWFGEGVAGGGGVNCDSYADIIVGAALNDFGGTDAGRAYVFFGHADPFPDTIAAVNADIIFAGEAAHDNFGVAVSNSGDLNNDGCDDLVVGANTNDAGGSNAGRAYVYACQDITPPVVTCPGDITQDNDPGECGALVDFSGTSSDNCELDTVFCVPPPGSFFPVGASQVECIAVDASGNADTCIFTVTVEDNEPPVAQCSGDVTQDNDPGECGAVVAFSASFTDNCSGGSIACTPPSGSFFLIGTRQVECIAVDAAGNADTCTFNVTVEDDDPSHCLYACEGVFREGHECSNAFDDDWMTSAVPDAYGDSIAVIECFDIPSEATSASWRFKVLRNNPDIAVRAYYWDYVTLDWELFYTVPENADYITYTADVPANGLLSSRLRTKMHVKNAAAPYPLQSGEYFEGEVDWVYSHCPYACEGVFRAGHECSMAVDGDWITSAVPDAYGDSIAVIECHDIPCEGAVAIWRFKVLRNNPDIAIRAYYWDYVTADWELFYTVPENADYITYTVEAPANGLLSSPLKTKMHVKNAAPPYLLQSGEYFEGAVDWCGCYWCGCYRHGDPQCDSVTNVLDVVLAVNVAFRGAPDIPDLLTWCPYMTTDVNCDGVTNVIDVVKFVNLAFRGGDPETELCDPCAP